MYNRRVSSKRRFKLISLLLLFIVGSHNACSQLNSSPPNETLTKTFNSSLSSPIPSDKIQLIESSDSSLFVSYKRIICSGGSAPERTLLFEQSTGRWVLTTASRGRSAGCELQKQNIENVQVFKASQLAVFKGDLFKQFVSPKNALNNENVAAVCEPQQANLDIGHSKLAGLVISWNKNFKQWETRLEYSAILESDNLTSQGPYGLWNKDPSFLIFNTSRTSAPDRPEASQRQKLHLEISHLEDSESSSPHIFSAILNYRFKVYGNHVHEITDALMTCWIDLARLD